MPDLDLKIVGGTLVDGTGAERRRADLGIRDGRVVAVGDVPAAARQTVDAGGRVVAPGFVDIHTHYDAQVLWDPLLTVSPWHGVPRRCWATAASASRPRVLGTAT